MRLAPEQVRHVAKLARLAISPEEERDLVHQLTAVLQAVETLAEVDTSSVAPTTFALHDDRAYSRDDVVRNELTVEQALANAPEHDNDSFVVPKVIE